MAITNNPNMTIMDFFVRSYIKLEANQEGTKTTFASNYMMDLVNKYFDILKRNKDVIEKTEDHFLNVLFVEAAGEMGVSEIAAVTALCKANNDVMLAISMLDLAKHQYIEYYVEELSKPVSFFFRA